MRKERVLIVTDYFYPRWTGICKSLYYMIQMLSNDIDIDILTVRYEKRLKYTERFFNSTIFREDYLFTLSRAKYSLHIVLKLFQLVKNYDVILINSPTTNIVWFAFIGKLFKKRVLILHQADLVLPSGIINKLIEFIYLGSSYIGFYLADKVSTWNLDYAIHSKVLRPFLKKFEAIPLPMRIPLFTIDNKIEHIMKQTRKEKKILLGFAGRFVEEKGFDILLDAIPEIKEQHPYVHFFYAGEVNIFYEKFFEKHSEKFTAVETSITQLGLLNEKELVTFYKNIDFIVVPSRTDAFPLVQAESIFLGTPAITSDIPGARFLIQQTGFGILFESRNAKDLAIKIDQALKNRTSILKNYPKVNDFFNEDKNREKILHFISS